MTHKNPLVSISVVTYNHKNFIKQCLDGILMQQTNFPFEIILGEDESIDGTRDICIDYANKYPDIINLFLRSRKDVIYINGNATGRFNFIENLKAANGKYIALCEGDDYWTDPLKLQKQVDFLERNLDYNICFHKVQLFEQLNNYLIADTITREVNETTDIYDLAKGNFIHTPSVMLRNNFTIPKWFSKSPIGDWPLYMLAVKDRKIKRLDEKIAVYRLSTSGIWSGNSQEYKNKKMAKCIKMVSSNIKLSDEIKLILKNRFYSLDKKPKSKFGIINRFKNKIINLLKG